MACAARGRLGIPGRYRREAFRLQPPEDMAAMLARQGRPPRGGVKYRLRPGAYAVLVGRDGRVLLTEQAMPGRLELQLPGGGIDPGEAPLPALHREVLEETGHRCGGLRRLGAYRRYAFMEEYGLHAEKLCAIFLGRAGPRVGPPAEAGHRAVWMDGAEAAGRLWNVPDRAWLARGLALAARGDRGVIRGGSGSDAIRLGH